MKKYLKIRKKGIAYLFIGVPLLFPWADCSQANDGDNFQVAYSDLQINMGNQILREQVRYNNECGLCFAAITDEVAGSLTEIGGPELYVQVKRIVEWLNKYLNEEQRRKMYGYLIKM